MAFGLGPQETCFFFLDKKAFRNMFFFFFVRNRNVFLFVPFLFFLQKKEELGGIHLTPTSFRLDNNYWDHRVVIGT